MLVLFNLRTLELAIEENEKMGIETRMLVFRLPKLWKPDEDEANLG